MPEILKNISGNTENKSHPVKQSCENNFPSYLKTFEAKTNQHCDESTQKGQQQLEESILFALVTFYQQKVFKSAGEFENIS